METKFDPKAKVKQGQFSDAAEGKQPNRESMNLDFQSRTEEKVSLFSMIKMCLLNQVLNMFKSSLFRMADEKDY